ncbi:MAG: glycosyl transferase family 1 [Holophagaceae bacterium]|nr:glycosyl transferase family 1 [Holophagaceae bacterium]
MEILYVAPLRSQVHFTKLQQAYPKIFHHQVQKFHSLLAKGLASQSQELTVLAVIPDPQKHWVLPQLESDKESGILFRYLKIGTWKGISHVLTCLWSIFTTLRWCRQHDSDRVVICDALNLSITLGAIIASKFTTTPIAAIVTDLPTFMNAPGPRKWSSNLFRILGQTLTTFLLKRYDYYILLTAAMDSKVNPKHRPSLVVEGMVDPSMAQVDNLPEHMFQETVLIYAGALYRQYGVQSLVEAFQKLPGCELRLWIYGSGELETYIIEAAKKDERIRYWGVCPNDTVVEAELKATLLINPRPATEAFTQYSFPSKNMEYMASGTPVLTAALPGMPPEYLDFVYTFPDSSPESLQKTLSSLLSMNPAELRAKGSDAKQFVLTSKTSLVQARRILAFFMEHEESPSTFINEPS